MAADDNITLKHAIASADLCALLCAAFSFPTREMAEGIADGSFMDDFTACLKELDVRVSLPPPPIFHETDPLLNEMKREYTRLYQTPGRYHVLYPYETAFRHVADGHEGIPTLFIAPLTLDVERWMKRFDALPENSRTEPVDHVATELDFLRLLYTSYANALLQEDTEVVTAWLTEISGFYRQHVDPWIPEFMKATRVETRSSVYLALAELALVALEGLTSKTTPFAQSSLPEGNE
ncbi:MAG: molecular chaperone TorD family protein [Coriobacteriales bacterium]|jgi:TorA maturation chaperone TorD|nr:molecular chaperone TorD family protein [Coriobacteriales bacterium]